MNKSSLSYFSNLLFKPQLQKQQETFITCYFLTKPIFYNRATIRLLYKRYKDYYSASLSSGSAPCSVAGTSAASTSSASSSTSSTVGGCMFTTVRSCASSMSRSKIITPSGNLMSDKRNRSPISMPDTSISKYSGNCDGRQTISTSDTSVDKIPPAFVPGASSRPAKCSGTCMLIF